MKVKTIFVGAIIWALGILVPVLHHGMLSIAAAQCRTHTYQYQSLVRYFFGLPWIVWVYLAAMWLVGTILVITGLRGTPSQQE